MRTLLLGCPPAVLSESACLLRAIGGGIEPPTSPLTGGALSG